MTDREAIDVLFNEWKCIDRNDGIHCDRKCESCDLVMDVEVIREAYSMAISALQAQEAKNSNESSLTQKGLDTISRQAAIDALDERFDSIPIEQTTEILLLRKDLRDLPTIEPSTNCSEIPNNSDLISRQALMKEFSDFVRASNNSDFARTPTWNDAVSLVGSMPPAQFKGIDKEIHEITESDKISYAIICDKFPGPHVYFNTYDEAARWARFNQPNYRPYYIIERSEHFEIVGEVR